MTDNLPEKKSKKPMTMTKSGISFSEISQITDFANAYAHSDAALPIYRGNPANAVVVISLGLELGISPIVALQNIYIVNNRPCMYSEMMNGLVVANPVCEYVHKEVIGEKDSPNRGVRITSKRKGVKGEDVSEFTMWDAMKAGLAKGNVWQKYPDRMLMARAVGFHHRDFFPDVIKGLKTIEEVEDTPQMEYDYKSNEPSPEEQRRILMEMDNDSVELPEEPPIVDKDQLSFLDGENDGKA